MFSGSTSAPSSPMKRRPKSCLLPGCTNHVCCPVLLSSRVIALDQCLPRKNTARASHSAWSGSVASPSPSGRPQQTTSCAYWMLHGRGQSKFPAPSASGHIVLLNLLTCCLGLSSCRAGPHCMLDELYLLLAKSNMRLDKWVGHEQDLKAVRASCLPGKFNVVCACAWQCVWFSRGPGEQEAAPRNRHNYVSAHAGAEFRKPFY